MRFELARRVFVGFVFWIRGRELMELGGRAVVTAVFFLFAVQMLFGATKFNPLDRRMTALLAAAVCKVAATNPTQSTNFVDFDVLVVLASIMILNHLLVQQTPVLRFIQHVVVRLRTKVPVSGHCRSASIWFVAATAFILAPLMTNDGLVLLLVDPVLEAWDKSSLVDSHNDRLHLCLAIACAANLGSLVTLVGNPQQILIASYSKSAGDQGSFGSGRYFLIMIFPALICFVLTTWFIDFRRRRMNRLMQQENEREHQLLHQQLQQQQKQQQQEDLGTLSETAEMVDNHDVLVVGEGNGECRNLDDLGAERRPTHPGASMPFLVLPSLFAVAVLELVGAVPLALLFPMSAALLGAIVVLVSYVKSRQHRQPWPDCNSPSPRGTPLAQAQSLTEGIFSSIDYDLLLIFGGAFIVSGLFCETGVPLACWNSAVGAGAGAGAGASSDFSDPLTLFRVVLLVVVGSQLLGNVPIIYIVGNLIDSSPSLLHNPIQRRSVWFLLAFASTVAGNLFVSGSACNIIVVEKASRHRCAPVLVCASQHFRACFAVTILGLVLGAGLVVGMDRFLLGVLH